MNETFPFPLAVTPEAMSQTWQSLCESGPQRVLRIYVKGGGCSGFSYGFSIDDEPNEDDHVLRCEGPSDAVNVVNEFAIVVDEMSAPMLAGGTLDWKDELMERSFIITNPSAASTCGCGSSFSI